MPLPVGPSASQNKRATLIPFTLDQPPTSDKRHKKRGPTVDPLSDRNALILVATTSTPMEPSDQTTPMESSK
jgi:hypothetical protein